MRNFRLLLIFLFFLKTEFSFGQLVSGNAFLKGNFVEVGIGGCGSFGTSVSAPAGYHPRGGGNILGFVSDPGQDGWTVGTPNYIGDYFVPGSPEEGWGLTINGINYNNNQLCSENTIPGSIINYSSSSTESSATWQGIVGGLNVTARTYIPLNSLYFVTVVTVTNTSATTINNIYYMRNVDPDQEQPLTGDYTTANNIVYQNPNTCNQALVSASGLAYNSYLGLGSIDARARVTMGGFSNRSAIDIWNGTGLFTSGANTADEAISIAFNIGNLAPNQSTKFSYAYILSEAQLNKALAATIIDFNVNGIGYSTGDSTGICSGTPIPVTINNTGTFTNWSWSPSTGLNTTTGTSVLCNITSPIIYTVTGTGPCDTVVLTIKLTPGVDIAIGNTGPITGPSAISLGQTNITYSVAPVSGAAYYNWQLPPGSIVTSPTATANSITFNAANTNWCGDIIVQPASNCGTGTLSKLHVSLGNTVSTGVITNSFCKGSSLNIPFTVTTTLNPGNIFTAELSDSAGNFSNPVNIGTLAGTTSSTINSIIPLNTPGGAGYRIRVKSSNPVITNCDNGTNLSISTPLITAIPHDATQRFITNGSIDIYVDNRNDHCGGTWNILVKKNGVIYGTILSSSGNPYSLTGLGAGTYALKITNACGCSDSIQVTVSEPAALPCSFKLQNGQVTNVTCNGSHDGSIVVNISDTTNNCGGSWLVKAFLNGILKATYTSASGNPAVFSNLGGGNYHLVGVNNCGCSDSVDLQVTEPPTVPVPVITIDGRDSVCSGDSVRLISSLANNIVWSTGETAPFIYAKSSGNYSVTYYDPGGCGITRSSTSVYVDVFSVRSTAASICPGDSIILSVTGNMVSYLWSTAATTSSIKVSPAVTTTYHISAVSVFGCSYSDSLIIVVNPVVAPGVVTNMIPANNTIDLIAPFNLSWLPGSFNTNFDLYVWPFDNVQPVIPTASGITAINYTIHSSLVTPGVKYKWQVVAKNGNCFSTPGPIQTFELKGLPDLIVKNITAPSVGSSGNQLAVSWQVKDSSDAATGNIPWTDHIWLSADTILQDNPPATDFYLGGVPNLTALLPGESYINTAVFDLPNGIAGTYHIIVKPNALGTLGPVSTLPEKDLSNNTLVSDSIQVNLTPSPDLQVSSVVIPVNAFSGINVNVTWKVKNFGADIISSTAHWSDKIYISSSPFLNTATATLLGRYDHTGNLQHDSSYTRSASIRIPDYISGLYYIYFQTDATNEVYEVPYETNNIASDVINVYLTPPPDLSAESITIPATGGSGSLVPLSWKVKNVGANATDNSWVDKIFITTNASYDLSNAVALNFQFIQGPLASGDEYMKDAIVTIPNTFNGKYYLYLQTNATNSLFENASSQNNIIRSDTSIQINSADLAVQTVTVPSVASSGEQVSISAAIKNIGIFVADKNWADKVFISSSPVFNQGTALEIGTLDYTGTGVNPGDSYNSQVPANIPDTYTGDYYLFFVTNANNILFENGHLLNNVRRSDTTIRISSPDVIVDSIAAPNAANSGQDITITWRVKNQGVGDILNAQRIDSVFLSSQSVFNSNTAIRLNGFSFTESVSAGYTVTKQGNIQIPNGLSGNYYLYVFTDASHLIFENANENNNITRSTIPIAITLSPSANLIVQSVQVPDSARSGFKMPISFTIKNTGNAAAETTHWVDKIYISPSSVWQADNVSLIGTFTRSQPLQVNDSYTITDSLLLKVSSIGKLIVNGHLLDSSNAYIYVVTDADSGLYEFNAENDNITVSTPVFIIPPRIDLEVTYVYSSDSAYSGDTAHVWWTVRNNGVSTAYKGIEVPCYWYDGVYLSQDSIWDPSDIFVFDWGYSNTPKDSSYSDSRTFTVPNGISGYYYLLMVADHKYNLHEDVKRSNNYILIRDENTHEPEQIHIILSPSPDLQITQATAPASGRAGQPVKAKWTVKNTGLGDTRTNGWEDGVYLSTDFNFDAGDILLGSKAHNGRLLPGQSYTDSMDITLPINASGNYVLIYKTDIHFAVYEYQAENNNTAYSLVSISLPPPSDLIVSVVNPLLNGVAGQQVSIDYTIKNNGVNSASGIMSDGIYLSRDTTWDISDQLIGTVAGDINLDPGEQVTRNLSTQLTGAGVGNYYVIVKTDLLNNIVETNDANNSKASNYSMRIDVKQLPLNVLTPDTLKNGNYLYYRIEIPDSLKTETLLITLKGDSLNASNELYLKLGDVPTRAVYDYNHGITNGGNQELLVPSLDSGTYYLAVYGSSTIANNQHITLYAEILPFAIRSVNASRGGNSGSVTVEIRGSKFEPNMQLRLDNGSGTTITATNVYYINTTKLFASFNLMGKPLGFYKVIAKKTNNAEAIRDHGFEIIAGTGGGFYTGTVSAAPGCDPHAANGLNSTIQVDLQYPASTRRNRIIAITILYGNSGNVDVPIPTRFVYSTTGAPLSYDVNGLPQNLQELYLEFKETNGPPNILRPGATGAITIYTKAVAPLNFLLSN